MRYITGITIALILQLCFVFIIFVNIICCGNAYRCKYFIKSRETIVIGLFLCRDERLETLLPNLLSRRLLSSKVGCDSDDVLKFEFIVLLVLCWRIFSLKIIKIVK